MRNTFKRSDQGFGPVGGDNPIFFECSSEPSDVILRKELETFKCSN